MYVISYEHGMEKNPLNNKELKLQKKKVDKFDYIKNQNFCTIESSIVQVIRRVTNM